MGVGGLNALSHGSQLTNSVALGPSVKEEIRMYRRIGRSHQNIPDPFKKRENKSFQKYSM